MKIRPYQCSDRNRLIELFRMNTPDCFAIHEQSDFEKYLDTHQDTYFVVEKNKTVLGSGGYHLAENSTGRISWNMVHPRFKRKGLGKKLVSYSIEKLKEAPTVKRLVVWTSQQAYIFYGKFGFRIKDIQKNYWGRGLDLYLMECPLY